MKYILPAIVLAFATPSFAQDIQDVAENFVRSPVQQKLMDEMLSPQMILAQMQGMAQQLPPEQLDKLVVIVTEELATIRPQMEQAMIDGAAQAFTVEEITALNEFYSSPIGASAMGKMTPFMQQTMGTLAPALQQMQQNIVGRVQKEFQ